MRSKSIVLLALALGCGLVAAIGISQVMDSRTKAVADLGDKQPIFVAMNDVAPNEELNAQNLKLEEWPKNIIPTGALTKLEEVEGKRTRMKIYAGEPILSSKILGDNESLGAAKEIPEGMRVVHVKVDPVTGSSNLILPGDRVDVLVFKQPGNDNQTVVATIVLQDIKVFAVDTHTETEYTRTKGDTSEPMTAKTIALLVTPQQSVVLHAATEISGSVRLVLRNPDDNDQVVTQGASVGDIFGSDRRWQQKREDEDVEKSGKQDLANFLNQQKTQTTEPPVPPAPTPRVLGPTKKMIVLYGSERQQVDFSEDGTPISGTSFTKGGPSFSGPQAFSPTGDGGPVNSGGDDGGSDDDDKPDDFISEEPNPG